MWFLDTSYLIALFSPKDTFHAQARALRATALEKGISLITSDAILFEVGGAFSKATNRGVGSAVIQSLLADPLVEVVSLSASLRDRAVTLFAERSDKDWSLCDCLSFVIMHEHSVDAALTADHHFTQAGFRALLLDGVSA